MELGGSCASINRGCRYLLKSFNDGALTCEWNLDPRQVFLPMFLSAEADARKQLATEDRRKPGAGKEASTFIKSLVGVASGMVSAEPARQTQNRFPVFPPSGKAGWEALQPPRSPSFFQVIERVSA